MTTMSSLHELRQELDQLGQRRERLASRVTAAADRLDSIGEPPGDDLIDDLHSYRERTVQLAKQLSGFSSPAAEATRDEAAVIGQTTLDDVKRLLSEREYREQAVEVLDQVLTLGHVEMPRQRVAPVVVSCPQWTPVPLSTPASLPLCVEAPGVPFP